KSRAASVRLSCLRAGFCTRATGCTPQKALEIKGGSMRLFRLLLLVATVSLLTAGCAFVRGTYGEEVKRLDVSSIRKGATTRAEVATLLGAPERIVEVNDHEIFQYYHYDMKSGLLLFFSRTNVMSEDVFVFFDGKGIVQDIVVGKKKPAPEMQFWPFGD